MELEIKHQVYSHYEVMLGYKTTKESQINFYIKVTHTTTRTVLELGLLYSVDDSRIIVIAINLNVIIIKDKKGRPLCQSKIK